MITSNVLYSFGLGFFCFLAGWFAGQATAWRRTKHGDKTVIVPAIADNVTRKRFFGAFLVLMAVATLLQGTYYNWTQGQCNQAFRVALESRSAIQRSDNDNIVTFFRDITDDISHSPPLTDADRQRFIAQFEERAAANRVERANTPYPSNQRC